MDHIFQETTDPGVGLAGALWSEASTSNTFAAVQHGVQSISENIHRRVGLLAGLHPTLSHENEDANAVLWREVDTLAEDPHQVRMPILYGPICELSYALQKAHAISSIIDSHMIKGCNYFPWLDLTLTHLAHCFFSIFPLR